MNPIAADILALLTAAAGWYYMFYSRAAHGLEPIESRPVNIWRVGLRRVNGGVLMLLGVMLFAGSQELPPAAFLAVWAAVIVLLILTIVLTWIDVRLTWKITQARRRGPRL